jgi:hypothetical protein
MTKIFLFSLILCSFAFAGPEIKGEFPTQPDVELTPGSLCDRPSQYRYPEKIAYCERDVDSQLKADVFREYRNLGWRLNLKNRDNYKIDHFIPLCMGGSNREDNLWPQHISIFSQTDLLEQMGCEKLKEGKIKQSQVIKLLIDAKKDLSLVPKAIDILQNL